MRQPSFFSTRYSSFKFALKGINAVFRSELNMQLHLLASVMVLVMAYAFGVTLVEWCILIMCIGTVWMAETFNTAIETLTDLVSPHPHPLAGKAKDLAAGAVLLAAITAATVGLIVFVPYWVSFFKQLLL